MEMTAHRNRDYWARPMQSDRMRHDYGNTHLGKIEWEPAYNPRKDLGWGMVCIVAVLALVLVFAAMTP